MRAREDPGDDHEGDRDRDDHDVVDDRRPHRGGEVTAGVQHRAGQRAHSVEENLRDEEVREDDQDVPVVSGGRRSGARLRGAAEQRGDRPGGRGRDHGDHGQDHRDEGEHPLGVVLAAIAVPLGGTDQQRHDDRGQDAADGEVVDGVRQRVGHVVGVAQGVRAERRHQHDRPEHAGQPGGEGPGRHHRAGPHQARAGRAAGGVAAAGGRLAAGRGGGGSPGRTVAVSGELGLGKFAFDAQAVVSTGQSGLSGRRDVGGIRAWLSPGTAVRLAAPPAEPRNQPVGLARAVSARRPAARRAAMLTRAILAIADAESLALALALTGSLARASRRWPGLGSWRAHLRSSVARRLGAAGS